MNMAWQLLSIEGRDSQDFLHRVSTAWAKKMQPGEATKSLLLSGTAKVIAPFFLLCVRADHFYLLVEQGLGDALFDGLEALHFAEEFTLKKINGVEARLCKKNSPGTEEKYHESDELFFPFFGASDVNALSVIIPFPAQNIFLVLGREQVGFSLVSEEEFLRARVENLLPARGREYTEESGALDVGFLPWIHRGKGCYPGQEVVERSLNVGHPARALVQIESEELLREGDELFVDEKKAGTLTSAFAQKALGIVQWKYKDKATRYQLIRAEQKIGEAECLK